MGKVYDLLVIGAGFAGMAGALFAAKKGLSVAQTGSTGGIDFSTGFIDLMGVHPVADGTRWTDPWAAIDAVSADCPQHPYAKLTRSDIEIALDDFTGFLGEQGLPYVGHASENTRMCTPAGTVKQTYRVPQMAAAGVEALASGAPTLMIDFHGLKGYSAKQIVATLGQQWPGLSAARLTFPGMNGELFPEHMAWSLANEANLDELARSITEAAAGVEVVGLPAVLGTMEPMRVVRRLEDLTGKKIFEIPTIPPSIGGPRLRAAFDRGLPKLGVTTYSQKMVLGAQRGDDGIFTFQVGTPAAQITLRARQALLAGGGFFGKGLTASRTAIVEPVFGLHVVQPQARTEWHRRRFLDAAGHPVNLSGINTDSKLRPIGADGAVVYDNLYAAGAILAHQDWMRQKCGAGLAVATAFKAVSEMTAVF